MPAEGTESRGTIPVVAPRPPVRTPEPSDRGTPSTGPDPAGLPGDVEEWFETDRAYQLALVRLLAAGRPPTDAERVEVEDLWGHRHLVLMRWTTRVRAAGWDLPLPNGHF